MLPSKTDKKHLPILMVEDSDEDYEAMRRCLAKAGVHNPLTRIVTGDEALDYLLRRGPHAHRPRPGLVLLDLNLPGADGHEVLRTMRATEALRCIPVLVLTSSVHVQDIERSYSAGANSYLVKPNTPDDLREVVDAIREFWLGDFVLLAPPAND